MYHALEFLRCITACTQAVQLHVNSTLDTALLDACLQQQEKGLAVTLVMHAANQSRLEDNPFLLNRCLQLCQKGASLLITDVCPDTLLYSCIADCKRVAYFYDADTAIHHDDTREAARQAVHHFNTLVRNSRPFHPAADNITITVTVSEDLVPAASYVTLCWRVSGADKVVIEGLGEVEHAGQRQILVRETTLFKVGAYNDRSVCITAVPVWAVQQTVIEYDIGFLSTHSNDFYSLVKAGNGNDTYGAAAGHRIRLRWRVLHAAQVHILPFDFTDPAGEHTFTAAAPIDITITAQIDRQTLTKKITLLTFPIPLLHDRLLSTPQHARVPALDADAMHGLTHTLRDSEQRYQHLIRKIHDYTFGKHSQKPTLQQLNTLVFRYLKRKHSGKTGVRGVIESLEHYYER